MLGEGIHLAWRWNVKSDGPCVGGAGRRYGEQVVAVRHGIWASDGQELTFRLRGTRLKSDLKRGPGGGRHIGASESNRSNHGKNPVLCQPARGCSSSYR